MYFEGSPQQKILGSYAVGEILLYFYIPMFPWKDFLMGLIRKIHKNKEGKNGGKKKKSYFFFFFQFPFMNVKVPVLVCSLRNTLVFLGLLPLCDPP
jgi:hypothetical protein